MANIYIYIYMSSEWVQRSKNMTFIIRLICILLLPIAIYEQRAYEMQHKKHEDKNKNTVKKIGIISITK